MITPSIFYIYSDNAFAQTNILTPEFLFPTINRIRNKYFYLKLIWFMLKNLYCSTLLSFWTSLHTLNPL